MKIIIPGVPVPQARMRHANFRGFTTTYDPNSKQKKVIREIIHYSRPYKMFDFPRISFVFYMPIPKSTKKKDLELYSSGILKHVKKPDVDNLVKLYLDCLDGIVLEGDQKVSLGPCIKVYGKNPRTEVLIEETKQQLDHFEALFFSRFDI